MNLKKEDPHKVLNIEALRLSGQFIYDVIKNPCVPIVDLSKHNYNTTDSFIYMVNPDGGIYYDHDSRIKLAGQVTLFIFNKRSKDQAIKALRMVLGAKKEDRYEKSLEKEFNTICQTLTEYKVQIYALSEKFGNSTSIDHFQTYTLFEKIRESKRSSYPFHNPFQFNEVTICLLYTSPSPRD